MGSYADGPVPFTKFSIRIVEVPRIVIVPASRIGTSEKGFWTFTTNGRPSTAPSGAVMQTRTSLSNSVVELLAACCWSVSGNGLRSTIAQRAVSLAMWLASIQ